MKKNIKRIIAAALASVMLFTDCASGFAAEVNTDGGTVCKTLSFK